MAALVLVGTCRLMGPAPTRIEEVALEQKVLPPPAPPIDPGHPAEVTEPGRIVLDLSTGEFEVAAGPPGATLRIEGSYDSSSFELRESYEGYGEVGWIYRVSFGRRGMGSMFHLRPAQNRLRLIVPRDMPVELEGRIGTGASRFELGGLWLVGIDLDLGTGSHVLRFGEPLAAPMERFELRASIGELRVESLGNASPRSVVVHHRVGEVNLGLHGGWSRDATVELRCGIGECAVQVPESVAVSVKDSGVKLGERDLSELQRNPAPGPGVPTLTLTVTGTLGEVRVGR